MPLSAAEAPRVTAVVLCGGSARRFGSDKTRADLAGTPVLDHVLAGLPGHWPVVCVGSPRPVPRDVSWCQEDPPGGGPLAALAASLPLVRSTALVLLGGDMPYAARAAPSLVAALDGFAGKTIVLRRPADGRGYLRSLPPPVPAASRPA